MLIFSLLVGLSFIAFIPSAKSQGTELIQSFPQENRSSYTVFFIGGVYPDDTISPGYGVMSAVGQVIRPSNDFIPSMIQFDFKNEGSPTGNLVVKIYPVSNGLPDETQLIAASNTVSASTFSSSAWSLGSFSFSTSAILHSGVDYAFVLYGESGYFSGSNNDDVIVGCSYISSVDGLGYPVRHSVGSWTTYYSVNNIDCIYYIYGTYSGSSPTASPTPISTAYPTPTPTYGYPTPTPIGSTPTPTPLPDAGYPTPTEAPTYILGYGFSSTDFIVIIVVIAIIMGCAVYVSTTLNKKNSKRRSKSKSKKS